MPRSEVALRGVVGCYGVLACRGSGIEEQHHGKQPSGFEVPSPRRQPQRASSAWSKRHPRTNPWAISFGRREPAATCGINAGASSRGRNGRWTCRKGSLLREEDASPAPPTLALLLVGVPGGAGERRESALTGCPPLRLETWASKGQGIRVCGAAAERVPLDARCTNSR